jgi:hypothetical protein
MGKGKKLLYYQYQGFEEWDFIKLYGVYEFLGFMLSVVFLFGF